MLVAPINYVMHATTNGHQTRLMMLVVVCHLMRGHHHRQHLELISTVSRRVVLTDIYIYIYKEMVAIRRDATNKRCQLINFLFSFYSIKFIGSYT